MKFDGQFRIPRTGQFAQTPICGLGYIEVSPDHLFVSGVLPPTHKRYTVLACFFLFLGMALSERAPNAWEFIYGSIFLITGSLVVIALKEKKNYKRDKPVSVVLGIPWDKIEQVSIESETLVIFMKHFKSADNLFFVPQNSPELVAEELSKFIQP